MSHAYLQTLPLHVFQYSLGCSIALAVGDENNAHENNAHDSSNAAMLASACAYMVQYPAV